MILLFIILVFTGLVSEIRYMEARFGAEAHPFYGLSATDMRAVGKRSLEWDLNDWKQDGDLFITSPLNPGPSSSGMQFFFLWYRNSNNWKFFK